MLPQGKWKITVSEIAKLTWPDMHLFAVAIVFAFLAALCSSAVSLWTGDALDALIKSGNGK
jgi:ABC-type multidrug transport system fused ATPase/permease subunit